MKSEEGCAFCAMNYHGVHSGDCARPQELESKSVKRYFLDGEKMESLGELSSGALIEHEQGSLVRYDSIAHLLNPTPKPDVADDTKPNDPTTYVLETMVKDNNLSPAAKFREIYEFISADTLALGAHEHSALVRGIALDVSLSRLIREHAICAIEQESFACGLSDDLSGDGAGDDANRLRSTAEFAIKHLDSMDEYSIVTGAIHVLSEALKQSKKPDVAGDEKERDEWKRQAATINYDRDRLRVALERVEKMSRLKGYPTPSEWAQLLDTTREALAQSKKGI